jgi:hypothetical protein
MHRTKELPKNLTSLESAAQNSPLENRFPKSVFEPPPLVQGQCNGGIATTIPSGRLPEAGLEDPSSVSHWGLSGPHVLCRTLGRAFALGHTSETIRRHKRVNHEPKDALIQNPAIQRREDSAVRVEKGTKAAI